MTWPVGLLAGLVWLSVWTCIFAKLAAAKEGDALVAIFHSLLPVFCVTTCLAAFAAVPVREAAFHKITLWTHHASILLLFLSLIAAEYFQAEAWLRIRRGCSVSCIAASFRRLWILTEIMPGPIALAVFLSGLRLIWDSPEANSPSSLWLFGLIVGFSLFFWDGILGYQPIVRRLWKNWKYASDAEIPVGGQMETARNVTDRAQLLLHCMSWPFVFLLGLFRWNVVTPFTRPILQIIARLRFLPAGWPEVSTAALIWIIAGITILLVRTLLRIRQASR